MTSSSNRNHYHYLLGIETEKDVFTYSQESPYLKEFIDSSIQDNSRYQNIFEKINLEELIKDINQYISKWKFDPANLKDLGPYFEFIIDRRILQSPEVVHLYKLKKEYTPCQALDYFKENEINLDCSLAISIFILFAVRKFWGDDEFNKLAPIFVLQGTTLETSPLFKILFRTKNYGQMKPCDLDEQKKKLRDLPIGTYTYIRGSIGWYQHITQKSNFKDGVETNRQGENSIYLGNGRFMGFWRDDAFVNGGEDNHKASFQIKTFDDIIESLSVNGKRTLSENLKNEAEFYNHRYLVYRLDEEDGFVPKRKFNQINGKEISQHIQSYFNQDKEDDKFFKIHNHFLPVGIAGFSDLYLDTQFFDQNNYQTFIEEQNHYRNFLSGLLLAYQRGTIQFHEILDTFVTMDNLQREYPILALTDSQRHIVFSLIGWDDRYPKVEAVTQTVKKESFVNFPTSVTHPELLSIDSHNKYPITFHAN